jgi:poly [ADP-ribose] polymerase 10/14/15
VFQSFSNHDYKPVTSKTLIDENEKSVKFKLVSDHQMKINEAKQQINEILQQDKTIQLLHHDFIKQLTPNHVHNIKDVCKRHNVTEAIDKDLSQIKIHGRNLHVIKCVSELNEVLNSLMINHFKKVQDIATDIKWEYFDNKTWRAYNIYLNANIEGAYQNKVKIFDFVDDNEETCCIDFGTSTQYKKIAKEKSVLQIRRVDLTNRLDMNFPVNWEQNKNNNLIKLETFSSEYQEIVVKLNSNKFGNKTIISIERVQNARLYIQYLAHKKHFEERNSKAVNEKTLYHGTTSDSVTNIWKFGFNRSYAGKNATVYGKGVYFARDASYSHQYTNLGNVGVVANATNKVHAHLFMCKVLIGYSALGNSQMECKNLPKSEEGSPVDSTINNSQDPNIFVIYHDAQAYPQYLITYE